MHCVIFRFFFYFST
ncbi:TPA: pheST operon leader peptide PheM [Providencia rettgeri]